VYEAQSRVQAGLVKMRATLRRHTRVIREARQQKGGVAQFVASPPFPSH